MISAILLAAGSGTRFGGDKLLAHLADGTPIGLASWRNFKRATIHCIVVVRDIDTRLASVLEADGASVVKCSDAQDGMSRSLIAGLHATRTSDGWIVALGDMPYIKPETIRSVASNLSKGALIVQPTFNGKRGHPVGLSKRLYSEMMQIRGDEGAREVIRRHADMCELIPCDNDPGILRDIDTRADLGQE